MLFALFNFVPDKTCTFRSIVSSSPAANYPLSPAPKKQSRNTSALFTVILLNFPAFFFGFCFFSVEHENTPLPLEQDWIDRPVASTGGGLDGGSQTGSGWVGEPVAGPLHFCSCSKLRPAASLGSFRSSCHFRHRLSSLTNQLSDLLQMLHLHVQVWNLFFPFQAASPYCQLERL